MKEFAMTPKAGASLRRAARCESRLAPAFIRPQTPLERPPYWSSWLLYPNHSSTEAGNAAESFGVLALSLLSSMFVSPCCFACSSPCDMPCGRVSVITV